MTSLILRTATRFLMPLLLMFALFLFLRGHNAPGGGFVGGLVVAAAFVLYAIASGTPASAPRTPCRPFAGCSAWDCSSRSPAASLPASEAGRS